MLDRLETHGEVPSFQDLAALLDRSRVSFASLTQIQEGIAHHAFPLHQGTFVSPVWILGRLDLGLRALRLERGLPQVEAAEAAGFKPSELSAVEDPRRCETPELPFLDRMLLTLGAPYADLEDAAFRPLGVARKVVREIQAAERRARPSEAELRAILRALRVRPESSKPPPASRSSRAHAAAPTVAQEQTPPLALRGTARTGAVEARPVVPPARGCAPGSGGRRERGNPPPRRRRGRPVRAVRTILDRTAPWAGPPRLWPGRSRSSTGQYEAALADWQEGV
jgi:transcriptional regulator with XRE-family HTH domain